MDFLNGELQLRPTFKQTMDSFRQVIPTIVDARIHEERLRPARIAVAKKAQEEKLAKAMSDAPRVSVSQGLDKEMLLSNITSEQVDGVSESGREALPDGHFVKEISDSYFNKEKTLLSANGIESKDKD